MKKILIFFMTFWLFFIVNIYAQNISNVAFINNVADKDIATCSDGVSFFLIILGEKPKSFSENVKILENKNIVQGNALSENSPLRRGTLALMIAKYLNLKDSLLFDIFKTERYAYRACAADEIMSYDGSEWEQLSGGELVEIMTKVSEYGGGNK